MILDRLRAVALIAVIAGAVGSLVLMLRAGHPPIFLRVLFGIWVLGPFVILAWAAMMSKDWAALTRKALYSGMLLLALGSVAVYAYDAVRPRKAQPAFLYVMVPPVSTLFVAMVVSIAALISRKPARERDGA